MNLVRAQAIGPVLLITIDHPPINATSHAVRAGLVAAIDELSCRPDLAAAVLMGAGSTFIAGADIREFGQPAKEPSLPAVIAAIEACRKPLVAALHDSALGGGLEVALACDARMALAGTVLGLPEVTLGVVPGAGGTQRLPRRVGLVRGIEMIGRGERIAADAGVAGISRWMRVHAWRTSDRFGVEGSAAMGRVRVYGLRSGAAGSDHQPDGDLEASSRSVPADT